MDGMKQIQIFFLTAAFLFSVGCVSGWLIEVFYRRFISKNNPERKWINPGFLVGPYLPLYGFGLVAVFGMSYIPVLTVGDTSNLTIGKTILIIVAMGVMMTVIEYIAGVIFINHMKIKLWDYSDRWGNIQGIICPLFSFYWTVMSAGYYFFIQPYIVRLVHWYYKNVAFTFFVGMFFGIFIVDECFSLHVGTVIKEYATENNIVVRFEEFKDNAIRGKKKFGRRVDFMVALISAAPIVEQLKEYTDNIKETATNATGKIKAKAEDGIDNLKNKAEDGIDNLKNKAEDGIDSIKEKFSKKDDDEE